LRFALGGMTTCLPAAFNGSMTAGFIRNHGLCRNAKQQCIGTFQLTGPVPLSGQTRRDCPRRIDGGMDNLPTQPITAAPDSLVFFLVPAPC